MIRFLIVLSLFSSIAKAGLCPALLSKVVTNLTTWRTPKLIENQTEYDKSLAFYASKRGKLLSESDLPISNDQKVAFLDAFRPEELRLSLNSMSKTQKKQLAKVLKKIDFKAGMSKDKLAEFFIETYLLSHPSNDTLFQRWKVGNDKVMLKRMQARFIEEFSKDGLYEAVKKFGIILPETRKEKIFNAISSYFQNETKIPGYLINKILREGFTDKNYEAFEKKFGKSERTRSLWAYLSRSLSWGLFGFFCYQDLDDEKEKNKQLAVEIQNAVDESIEEALEVAKEIREAIPDDVNIKEHLLAEWLKEYIEIHGLPPQEGTPEYKEYEELKRMLSKEVAP